MLSTKEMQNTISLILLSGTLLSAALVIIGGIMYLSEHGSQIMPFELLQTDMVPTSMKQVWQFALSFSSLAIIELGLLLLVATQMVRVALLCWFYAMQKDLAFLFISLFVLVILIYSCFWRS
jgi:uncharacterized membrane protein